MAIKVTSEHEVKQRALRIGASAKFADGEQFNSARITAHPAPIQAQAASSAKASEKAPDSGIASLLAKQSAAVLIEQQRLTEAVIRVLNEQQRKQSVPAQAWVFDVERDDEQRITRIVARPEG